MFSQLASAAHRLLISVAHLYTIPQLVGFVATFVAVVMVSAKQGRSWRRFFQRPFLNDLAYAAWLPLYTVLFGIPLSIAVAGWVVNYVPFLQLHLLRDVPWWVMTPLWLVLNDFFLYWLHRSMHKFSWLWALHKIHHSQTDLNPLTTWRNHWLELIYVSSSAFVTSLLLGYIRPLHPIVLGLFAVSQFAQHSDIDWTYGPIGRFIVSPRFHSRHHSTAPEDLNVNFGGLLIIWDDLFGTARKVPGRPAAYGLVGSEDDVPRSFFLQLFYPLSLLLVKARRPVPAQASEAFEHEG